ncbi:MAG TPA: LysR family transcriptional regulator [Vicinamibacterales bacterium]|nr:LysR family transcriptional regulator [Vicinamibacterales bacterium]
MDLFELEVFLAIVREGSFSKAGKAVYRTQPAVTQIVHRLESELGQPLFDRSSRRGVLTDAGRVLLEHGERLMNFKEQALAAVADVRHLRRGQLVLATNELTCLYVLPLLREYRRRYPDVAVSVRRGLASRIPADVRDYGADLGVVTYQPADAALASVVVYRDQLAFVVPQGHRFAKRREVRIKDLGGEAFVAHHVASPYRAKVVETFRRRRVTLWMPVEMPTIEAIKKFVATGHGVALLPAIAVESELSRGELVRVRVAELSFERPVRVVWRKAGVLSHAAAAFLQVAEAHAGKVREPYSFVRD